MNRRGFFKTLAAAAAGFTILPPATTYDRIWKTEPKKFWVKNPEWEMSEYTIYLAGESPFFEKMFMQGGYETARFRNENGVLVPMDSSFK